ncbi:MAG: S-formylglutathione hydrolase [Alphaproteobacteria bacterium]|nr:S-formylglutathione hydrolase [Alphaproteobacteria bacterium]
MENISNSKCFGGWLKRYKHRSDVLNCEMNFSIFLPPQVNDGGKVPVLYWLSGLTCTDENFMQKASAQRVAAELGMALVVCDTSPRGDDVADDDGYDMGKGAGFYLNATQEPWAKHFHMYDYVVNELPALIAENFPITDKCSIAGHSMGGHGALTLGLSNSDRYLSISAFSPIVNPSHCPWGKKAFENYLGKNREMWKRFDATELVASATSHTPIMIDQGLDDEFLAEQLKPQNFLAAAKAVGYAVEYAEHEGYDHGFYFLSTFMEKHLRWHYKHLTA